MTDSLGELVVPDRRRRRRIVTLKNTGLVVLAVLVVFAAMTIRSEMRRGTTSGEYGTLYSKQVPREATIAKQTQDVVTEAPVPDVASADPMLIAPATREQYLGVTTLIPADVRPAVAPASAIPPPSPSMLSQTHGKVAIVGGSDGVAVVTTTDPNRPKLSGGVFRQP